MKDKKYRRVTDHCHYTGEFNICNLNYSVPKITPIVFHNRSNYHYHFIITDLAAERKKKFTYLIENTEKYITFTVPI